jgi:hypothetical protein
MDEWLEIVHVFYKEADNLESAYLSSELAILHAWELAKPSFGKKTKDATAMQKAQSSIVSAYWSLCANFLQEKILSLYGVNSIGLLSINCLT